MADNKSFDRNELKPENEKSQVINTAGGEMPDPGMKPKTPSESEVRETFDSLGGRGGKP